MTLTSTHRLLLPLLLFLFLTIAVQGQSVPIPARIEGTFIQDHAGVLTPEQEAALEQKVRVLQKERNIEFGIVTVPTTGGINVHDYTTAVFRAYGIGSAEGEHRGLIVLLAVNDHKWSIQPSRHIEGWITDGQCGEIGRAMQPLLRKEDYDGALNLAVDRLTPLALGTAKAEATKIASDQNPILKEGFSLWWLLLLLVPLGAGGGYLYLRYTRRREEELREEDRRRREREARATLRAVQESRRRRESGVDRILLERPSTRPTPPHLRSPSTPKRHYTPPIYTPTPVDDTPSYSSSRSSDDYGSSYSSSSDSGSSFGGSSDAGGGGADGGW
jgi:uncharacterized protein